MNMELKNTNLEKTKKLTLGNHLDNSVRETRYSGYSPNLNGSDINVTKTDTYTEEGLSTNIVIQI